jgi:hypothetical protein
VNRRRSAMFAMMAVTTAGLSCAGQTLNGKVDGYDKILQEAIADGSKTIGCAPKETAIAEANIRFARDALTMGEYYRGKEHAEKADLYTTLARKKTDPVRCKDPNVVRDNAPAVGDRDGDGYDDGVDKCPDDPEDFDSFEDDDGCPDKDNDKDGVLDASSLDPNRKWINLDKKTRTVERSTAATSPRTSTSGKTRTAAPIRTTTATRCSTASTSARTTPRTSTSSRTRMVARTSTTTATRCSTRRS